MNKNDIAKELKRIMISTSNFIIDNFLLIVKILFVILIIFILRIQLSFVFSSLILVATYIIISFLENIYRKSKLKMPVLKEDLTEKNYYGDIIVKRGKINQLIVYCNMVEDYIRKNNLR